MKTQKGFTLIELVVVIVILGILAATALPKFVDLSSDAGNAAASGVAGAISSGSAMNYATRKVNSSNGVSVTGANVCTNTTLANFVSGVTLVSATPASNSEYLVGGTGNCGTGDGTTVTCTIKGEKGVAQNATVTCVP